MTKFTVTYLYNDKYDNACFSVSAKADSQDEKDSYAALCKWHRKLKKTSDSFLPIYSDESEDKRYATLRLKKNSKMPKFSKRALYRIQCEIKKTKHDGKCFVNVVWISSKLVREAKPIEEELLDLTDDEDCSE